jgi:hypothetical protein
MEKSNVSLNITYIFLKRVCYLTHILMFDSLSHRVLVFIFILPSFDILLSYNLVGHVPKNFKFGVINPEINYDLDQCNTTYTTFQKCSANLGCSYLNTLPESVIKPVRLPIYKRLHALTYV